MEQKIVKMTSSSQEHHERTHLCLQAIQKGGLVLRQNKYQVDMTSLTFLWHHISTHAIKPDDHKISAITNYPTQLITTNVNGLQRFPDMVTYFGKFIPNLLKETAPLRKLLETDIEWRMDRPQIEAF